MENLSNELLIKAYIEAMRHGLDPAFQLLLKEEISRRKLKMNDFVQNNFNRSNQTI